MEEAFVTEALGPVETGPCFAVPILRLSSQSNAQYVQEVGSDGLVVGFEACEPPMEAVRKVPPPFWLVAVGSEPAHCIVDPEGVLLVGGRDELADRVGRWLPLVDQPIARLVFAEFVRDLGAAEEAAAAAFAMSRRTYGERAARRWYVDSIITSRVHKAVLRQGSAIKETSTLERLAALAKVEVSGENLHVSLPVELREQFGVSTDDVRSNLDGALRLARPLGAKRMELEVHSAEWRRRRLTQSRPVPVGPRDRAAAIVIIELPELFTFLARRFVAEGAQVKDVAVGNGSSGDRMIYGGGECNHKCESSGSHGKAC